MYENRRAIACNLSLAGLGKKRAWRGIGAGRASVCPELACARRCDRAGSGRSWSAIAADVIHLPASSIGGIGEAFDIDPTLVRLVVIFLCFATAIFPVVLTYLIAWAIVPEEPAVWILSVDLYKREIKTLNPAVPRNSFETASKKRLKKITFPSVFFLKGNSQHNRDDREQSAIWYHDTQ